MKKRILSIVLAIVMIVGMLPLTAITAFAEDTVTEYYCLEVDAGAYINTGIFPTSNTRVVFDAEVSTSTGIRKVFGVWGEGNFEVNCTLGDFGAGFGSTATWVTPFVSGRHKIELDRNVFKLDGETKHTFTDVADFESAYKMYLFAINSGNEIQMEDGQHIRFYSCEIFDEYEYLIHKFVPAKQGDTVGVLDKITGDFLAIQGDKTAASLIPGEPVAAQTANCGVPGWALHYKWNGKLYEDQDCTIEIPKLEEWASYTPATGNHTTQNGVCSVCGKAVGKYIERYWDDSAKKVVETEKPIPDGAKLITSGTTVLSDGGWYVLASNVNVRSKIKVMGTSEDPTNIILMDGYTLTADGGISVLDGYVLNIYGQKGDRGKIVATGGTDTAGIGGCQDLIGGTVTIYGGTVEANGGDYGAGIGSGRRHSLAGNGAGGNVTVNGGTVNANGGKYAAGIGGGEKGSGGNVTVNGGTVNANGGNYAAGIGGGYKSDSTIYGGAGGNVTVNGGTVNATGGDYGAEFGGIDAPQAIGRGSKGNSSGSWHFGASSVIKAGANENNAPDTSYNGQHYVQIHFHNEKTCESISDTQHKCSFCEETEDHAWVIGETEHTCSVCGKTESHNWVNDTNSETQHKCSFCGATGEHSFQSGKCFCGAEQCTVTFDVQGHGTAPVSQTVVLGEKVTKPTDPTAVDYEFGGWYKEAECITPWDFDTDTVSGNTTIYAKWTEKPSYTVIFDMQGHGTAPSTQTVKVGEKITRPTDPTADGCIFDGWYKDAQCVTPWNFETDIIAENTTLYAKWTIVFSGISLTLGSDISINFYMELTDKARENGTMTFDIGGRIVTLSGTAAKYNSAEEKYYFQTPLTVLEMAETVTATFTYNGTTYIEEFSVVDYIGTILYGKDENGNDYHPAVAKKLAKKIANYGYYAQWYLESIHTNVTIDDGETGDGYAAMFKYSDSDIDMPTDCDILISNSNFVVPAPTDNFELYGRTVYFDSATALNYYITVKSGAALSYDAVICKDKNGNDREFEIKFYKDNIYIVSVKDITATELDDDFTVTVGGEFVLTGSVLDYCGAVTAAHYSKTGMEPDDELAVNAMAAFYEYYKAAYEYAYRTVTFDMGGHGTQIPSQTVIPGDKATKPEDPEEYGFEFGGWYKEQTLQNKWNFETDTVTGNVTLYAKWINIEAVKSAAQDELYKVYQETGNTLNDLSWLSDERKKYYIEDKLEMLNSKEINSVGLPESVSDVERALKDAKDHMAALIEEAKSEDRNAHQKFIGDASDEVLSYAEKNKGTIKNMEWLDDEEADGFCDRITGILGDAMDRINDAESKADIDYTVFDVKSSIDSIVGEAEQHYTVTFDMMGHGDAIPDQPVKPDGKVKKPTDPTADGWKFDGWYKDSGFSESWNFDTDTVTMNTTLYAKWTEKVGYTVTFEMMGHGTAPISQTVEKGSKVAKPDDPVAEGWIFGGWYKDPNLQTAWNFDTDTVTADTTLYARWTENTPAEEYIYLNTGGSSLWSQANATFAVWTWGGNLTGSKAITMTKVSGDIYAVKKSDLGTSIIFLRVANGRTFDGSDWSASIVWNQTAALNVPTETKSMYTITGWGGSDGYWGVYGA